MILLFTLLASKPSFTYIFFFRNLGSSAKKRSWWSYRESGSDTCKVCSQTYWWKRENCHRNFSRFKDKNQHPQIYRWNKCSCDHHRHQDKYQNCTIPYAKAIKTKGINKNIRMHNVFCFFFPLPFFLFFKFNPGTSNWF